MEAIDLDTVIIVDKTGYDEQFDIKHYPAMISYIEPLPQKHGHAVLHIEIPIKWTSDEEKK